MNINYDYWVYFLIFLAAITGAASRDFIKVIRERHRCWVCPECDIRFSANKKQDLEFIKKTHPQQSHPFGEDILIGEDLDDARMVLRGRDLKLYKILPNELSSLRAIEGLRMRTVYITPYVLQSGLDADLLDVIYGSSVRSGRPLKDLVKVLN